jgi:hypothetical protein
MQEYQRFSLVSVKDTTKRPECFLYQGAFKAVGYDIAEDGWFGTEGHHTAVDFQKKNGLRPDGEIGRMTATPLVAMALEAGYEPPLIRRIQSVITIYEGSTRKDAYGMTSVIADGAGANYGVMQCNRHGSCQRLLQMAGQHDLRASYLKDVMHVNPAVKDFFGSVAGIKAQNDYFEKIVVKIAMRELRAFGLFDSWETNPERRIYWERAVLLFCDSVIQNGTMWSGMRKPFWKAITAPEESDPKGRRWPELYYGTWWDKMLGHYIPYKDFKARWWEEYEGHGGSDRDSLEGDAVKAANISTAKRVMRIMPADPEARLVLLAQMRSRSSWDKYWFQAVGSRRITDACGSSTFHPSKVVNGSIIDLQRDYYLGVPVEDADEKPMVTNRDSFVKDVHADILDELGLD